MRKLFILFMCLVAMLAASTSLKAQEVTITLNPGWTWISYLGTEPQGFATALGSFTPEVGDVIKSQWGNATYMANGQWKGSITQFYPGYGYMYKSARAYPVSLTLTPQQPAPQVVVTTSEPMLITAISAMGGGEVTVSDGTYILVKGLCWATHENPTTNDDFYQEAESGVGSFSLSMTGLNISTTYYVRAYAVTGNGTVYGDQKTFTTRDGIPTLTTAEITNITGATATCGGDITDNGGLNVTARGVCWSTSQNPTVSDSHTTNGSGTGSFSSSITGLSVSTTYYVRAYATTAAGTGYGDEKTFTTRDGIPSVTTADVTDILAESATCGGDITDDGGLDITARGVCWSTSPNPTIADSLTTDGNETGSFSSSITGLNLSTAYYVRAYATTTAGTGYGEQLSFTTRNGIPTLTTAEITNIGSGCAYSGGNITDDGGLAITARGVCWSISPNPTLADIHATNGSGMGSFTSFISGLSCNTTYYVRAYATNSIVTIYGNQLSFTTIDDDHVYIDLGLPSGLLWATCNIGADTPEGYGDYFAWGEITPKDTYTDGNYTYTDFHDAATANWGNGWRMPTYGEFLELSNNTTCTWTTLNGVNGRLFTATNGNSLFLPAAGYRYGSSLYSAGSSGGCWSRSRLSDDLLVWVLYFNSEAYVIDGGGGYCGRSVRPVRSSGQN